MRRLGAVLLLLAGCGEPKVVLTSDGGVLRATGLKGSHLASCDDSACGGAANPPLGGDHCSSTLACRKYTTPQSRCAWIHNLEHGHAVLAYNCPTGCSELVGKLEALFDSKQSKRLLVTPDPRLPTKVAALVWGFGWQGDGFDAKAIDEVLSHQDEEAPEPGLGCSQ